MMKHLRSAAWIVAVSWSLSVPAFAADEALAKRVEEILKTKGYENGHWGILVVDSKTGEPVYERNADLMFCPASVTKLFSGAAALVELGAEHRFVTPLVRRGEVGSDGILRGDLILVAQGDLNFGGRMASDGTLVFEDGDHTYANGNLTSSVVGPDPRAALDHLARQVKEAGIKEVRGDVLVDDRIFVPSESSGSGPTRVTSILVNDNLVDVVANPAEKAGEPAKVRIIPETDFVTLEADVETVEASGRTSLTVETVGPRRFRARGRIPVGHKPVVKVYEVEEPADFARCLLIEALRRRDVRVTTAAIGSNDAERLPVREDVKKLPKVAEFTSPPFKEALKVILKVSHNLHASTLPLLLAAHRGDRHFSEGIRHQSKILKDLGVDVGAISFGGGAGGARADLVTPRATVALLRAMAARPDFPAYEAGLPVLGRDGTLAKAVGPDSPAKGHARAKTGTYTLNNSLNASTVLLSKALAGYMETASGRRLTFAFFVNNVPYSASGDAVNERTLAAGQLLGRLCETFYESDKSADVSQR